MNLLTLHQTNMIHSLEDNTLFTIINNIIEHFVLLIISNQIVPKSTT